MSFTRPTLPAIVARIRTDIETKLAGADADVRRTFEDILAVALAGGHHLEHGHLVWLSTQLFADTADAEFVQRWASLFGLTIRAAVKATTKTALTITGTVGADCPSHTKWQTAAGVVYDQDALSTIGGGGSITIALTADVAGVDGNAASGVTLSLVSPVTGIDSSATLTGDGIEGGLYQETTEELRARLLQRLRNPPKGGGTGDYINWALEVAGVTRAWEYPNLYGVGTVGLAFVCDSLTPIIPDPTKLAEVAAHIETKCPVTISTDAGTLFVFALTPLTYNVTASITPNTGAVQAAAEAEIADLLLREAEPNGTVLLSHLDEVISRANGETDHVVTSPVADFDQAFNEIAVMGTVTWV